MEQKKMRIGELAQSLNVERFVVRFWEKEFEIPSERSEGGQRFFTLHDIEKFKLIKELLYEKGFTIAGAKKHLSSKKNKHDMLGATKTEVEPESRQELAPELYDKLLALKEKLRTLKELL